MFLLLFNNIFDKKACIFFIQPNSYSKRSQLWLELIERVVELGRGRTDGFLSASKSWSFRLFQTLFTTTGREIQMIGLATCRDADRVFKQYVSLWQVEIYHHP